MSDEKSPQTIREFTSQSSESPDPERVSLDVDEVQVIDSHNLPESSKTSDNPQVVSEEKTSPTHPDRGGSLQDNLVVVEYDVEDGSVVKRVYVDDLSAVPEGVELREGDRGGLYYDEDSAEFLETQLQLTRESLEETDYSDDEIEDAIQSIQEHNEYAGQAFEKAMNVAEEVGANVTYGTHRVKGVGSTLDKVYGPEYEDDPDEDPDKYETADDLTDVHGSMLVVDDLDEAQDTYESMISRDDVEVVKEKNHMEDADGPYRAHHVVFEVDDGVYSEVQIKEERMSQIADVSHSLVYKPQEAPVDEMESLDERPEENGPMANQIEDCLTQQADLHQGLIEEDDLDCNEQAFNAIREMLQIKGYV